MKNTKLLTFFLASQKKQFQQFVTFSGVKLVFSPWLLRVETKIINSIIISIIYNIIMANLESKMAILDEAKGDDMARLCQKKLQKPAFTHLPAL
ncbi:MAG: hypothetical protein GY820_06050 [Gammaproteobacteria bacterium]|nr:hypothetical protein [Gammaproteobacteria bacterium]